jgi:hypothetical protein
MKVIRWSHWLINEIFVFLKTGSIFKKPKLIKMKKIIIAVVLFCFFVSCQDKASTSSNQFPKDSTNTAKFKRRISPDTAKLMTDKFTEDTKLNFKGIIWAGFSTENMKKIYTDSTVSMVRFFVGLYLSNDESKKTSQL